VKSGTATEIEATIVKKMDKGTHPGYVVLDENGFAATFPTATRARLVARARMGASCAPRTAAGLIAATFPTAARARKVAQARMGAGASRTAAGFAATFPTATRARLVARARMGAGCAPRTAAGFAATFPTAAISLTCKCVRLARCAFAGKKIKEAHAKVKSGTATEIEATIVKKMDKGTHPGYVVLDENGDMRNA
jgi:hypothetical protein